MMLYFHNALTSDTHITPHSDWATSLFESTIASSNHISEVREASDDFSLDPNTCDNPLSRLNRRGYLVVPLLREGVP